MKISRQTVVVICLSVFVAFAERRVVNADHPQSPTTDTPAVLSAVAPYYPLIALTAHAIGTVVVAVEVDAKGIVTFAKATSGHPLLQKACETTAMRWRFVEAEAASGKRQARLTFVFRFSEDTPKAPEDKYDLITFKPPYQVEVVHRFEAINSRQANRS